MKGQQIHYDKKKKKKRNKTMHGKVAKASFLLYCYCSRRSFFMSFIIVDKQVGKQWQKFDDSAIEMMKLKVLICVYAFVLLSWAIMNPNRLRDDKYE